MQQWMRYASSGGLVAPHNDWFVALLRAAHVWNIKQSQRGVAYGALMNRVTVVPRSYRTGGCKQDFFEDVWLG